MEEKLADLMNKHSISLMRQQNENEDIRDTLKSKLKSIEKEYIKISDHEKLIN